MKVNICDVCMQEGKVKKAAVRLKWTRSIASIHLCEEHRKLRPANFEVIQISNASYVKFNEL
jgi:hypothetical protein